MLNPDALRGFQNLTGFSLWLFSHGWNLVVNKNHYWVLGNNEGDVYIIKFDKPVHIYHSGIESQSEYSIWQLLVTLYNKGYFLSQGRYEYYIKEDKVVGINHGSKKVVFIDNVRLSQAVYDGGDISFSDKIYVKGRCLDSGRGSVRPKEGARQLDKLKLEKVKASQIWSVERRKFGE